MCLQNTNNMIQSIAKHVDADKYGVRIVGLDEISFGCRNNKRS